MKEFADKIFGERTSEEKERILQDMMVFQKKLPNPKRTRRDFLSKSFDANGGSKPKVPRVSQRISNESSNLRSALLAGGNFLKQGWGDDEIRFYEFDDDHRGEVVDCMIFDHNSSLERLQQSVELFLTGHNGTMKALKVDINERIVMIPFSNMDYVKPLKEYLGMIESIGISKRLQETYRLELFHLIFDYMRALPNPLQLCFRVNAGLLLVGVTDELNSTRESTLKKQKFDVARAFINPQSVQFVGADFVDYRSSPNWLSKC